MYHSSPIHGLPVESEQSDCSIHHPHEEIDHILRNLWEVVEGEMKSHTDRIAPSECREALPFDQIVDFFDKVNVTSLFDIPLQSIHI